MSENVLADEVNSPSIPLPRAVHAIGLSGLAVGTLDGIAACINAATRGVMPDRVFKYIASALLGREAANVGGFEVVLLGVLMHYGVAFGVATAFYVVVSRLPALLRYPLIVGPIYGVVVYFMMAYAIVPLTRVVQGPFNLSGMIVMIIIHMVCVGSPPALITAYLARRSAPSNEDSH
ncbi:MAG TPA: hypothetical protein VJL58_03275 [Pyrinomonadaceae bacterium]|nr:hypothetical protein [Pyrinomonadaceae bacterium]